MTGRLLTARQVADLLGVHVETVLAWVRRGDLPAFRMPGGALRFREADLDAWLQERATRQRGESTTTPRAARLSTVPSIGSTTTEDEEPHAS